MLHKGKEMTFLLAKRERAACLYGGRMRVLSVRASH